MILSQKTFDGTTYIRFESITDMFMRRRIWGGGGKHVNLSKYVCLCQKKGVNIVSL